MRLELEPEMTVVGEAKDGPSAVRMAADLSPDVVIMDVGMPGGDGIDAAAAIRSATSDARIVVLTIHDDAETRRRAEAAGVSAFVVKQRCGGDLIAAIRGAAEGLSDGGDGPSKVLPDRQPLVRCTEGAKGL